MEEKEKFPTGLIVVMLIALTTAAFYALMTYNEVPTTHYNF